MKPKKSRSAKAVKKGSHSTPPSPAATAQPGLPRPRRTAAKAKVARQQARSKPAVPPAQELAPAPTKALKGPKQVKAKAAGKIASAPARRPKPLKRKRPLRRLLQAKAPPKSAAQPSRQPARRVPGPAPVAPVQKVAPASIPPTVAEPFTPKPVPSPAPAATRTPAGAAATPEQAPTPAKPALQVPPILLEGDEPSAPPLTGPGQKYALGPTPPVVPSRPPEGHLPEAYGTGRLFLTARDPHCLYAHWDIAAEQQRRYNALSVHQHLILRVYLETITGRPLTELPVHPESTHWFIHVDRAGMRYAAELGYYQPDHQWRRIAPAEPVLAPPETVAEEQTVQFATILPEVPLVKVAEPARKMVTKTAPPPPSPTPPPAPKLELAAPPVEPEPAPAPVPVKVALPVPPPQPAPPPVSHVPPALAPAPVPPAQVPAKALLAAEVAATPQLPPVAKPEAASPLAWRPTPVAGPPPPAWTPAQEQALAELVSTAFVRQEWVGSAEITELIRRQARQAGPAQEEIGSIAAAQFGAPAPAEVPLSVSSPMGEAAPAITSPLAQEELARRRGFWFNVNAELIIYGATEPDATVTIGGRQIRLRPDGTFSYRFALPDGNYALPIAAQSVDGEVRRAELDFHRGTRYDGEVGAHPQDPALKRPTVENVS